MDKKNVYWLDVMYKKFDGSEKFLEIELTKKQWEQLKKQLATTPKLDDITEFERFTSEREYYPTDGCGLELVHHIRKK